MSATWRRPKGALVALAIAMTACVGLKPNQQSERLKGDGGPNGQATATGGSTGANSASGVGGSAGTSGEGGAGDTGSGGTGDIDDAGDADAGIDESDSSEPDASDDSSDADDASDGPSAEPCVSTCEREGTFGCSATGGVQVCSSSGACLAWRDVGPCPGQHLCCSGVCIQDNGLVPATCSNPTPEGYDFYVDANANESVAANLGKRTNPFKTITRALRAAAPDGAAPGVRIYVARGTYDAKLGEEFPIILPGGVTLDGAGAARTTIAGLHRFLHTSRGTSQEFEYFLTMVMGDKNAQTHVSGFSIVPGDAIPMLKTSAIMCDRGAPPVTDGGQTGPDTFLSDLVVGPGYETGIVVGGTGAGQPVCNLQLRASKIVGGRYGVWFGNSEDLTLRGVLELGDGTPAGGNTFTLQKSDYSVGQSVNIGALSRLDASYNTFTLTNQGIYIGTTGDPPSLARIRLNHNKFDRIDYRAIALWGGYDLVVDEFADNEFRNVTLNRPGYRGDATALYIRSASSAGMPFIDHARRNLFYRCDSAIRVVAYITLSPTWSLADFGSQTDPGNNIFHCNGPSAQPGGGPGSIYFDFTQVPVPIHFELFQGNSWDTTRLDPITLAPDQSAAPWPAGDIFRRSDKVTLNTAGAKVNVPNDCPP